MTKRNIGRGLLVCCLLLCGGCTTVTYSNWQDRVEEFIAEEASNDPNVLRDMTWDKSQKGFSVISASLPDESTDVNGVLLGHKEVGGRKWFIFLAGQVAKREVQSVKLAAMALEGTGFRWEWSASPPESFKAYLDYKQRVAAEQFKGEEMPTWFRGFPAIGDAFELTISGSNIIATHRQSGAKWEVGVAAGM